MKLLCKLLLRIEKSILEMISRTKGIISILFDKYWERTLIVLGFAVAVLNMVIGWIIIVYSINVLHLPPVINRPLDSGSDSLRDVFQLILSGIYKVSNSFGHERVFTNILILSFSFALSAIGFSLLVMGIHVAADLYVKTERVNVYFKTTSPGIICILGSVVLMLFILLSGSSSLTYPPYPPYPPPDLSPEQMKADAEATLIEAKARAIEIEAEARARAIEIEAGSKARVIDAQAEALRTEADSKAELIEVQTNSEAYLLRHKLDLELEKNTNNQK